MTENNQSTSISLQNGNSFAYIDQMISLRIFKTIEELMKDINLKSVILLIGLLGADSLKKIVKICIENILSKLKDTNLRLFLMKITSLFKKKQQLIKEKPVNKLILNYTPKQIFWDGIDKIMKSDKDSVSFKILSNKIDQVSKIEYILNQTVTNFEIKYYDWNCWFSDNIILKYNCVGDNKKIDSGDYDKFVFDKTKTLFENLPFPDFIEDYKKSTMYKNSTQFSGSEIGRKIGHDYLAYKYDDSKIYQEVAGILFAGRTFKKFGMGRNFKLFDIEFTESMYMQADCFYGWGCIRDTDKVKQWVDLQLDQKENEKKNCTSFNLCLTSDNLQLNLLECWTNFVNDLQKGITQVNSNTIKIYDIKMITKEIKTQIDNPNYSVDKNGSDNGQLKFLEKIEYKKEINETHINQIYKDFSTLYLKEQDSFILNGCLDRFKNKKDLYKNLGLPYKFGALLYGEPGTGKSSCINAISSYLSKDIYYLDLTTVKTNDELKLLFNHINKEKSENGIIVIEDIDAMTNVVHDRQLMEIGSESGDLTLECLLNLLQGTLTHDGTTFLITTNHIEKLDPAFYRDGRFDIKMELTPCDYYQMNVIYNKFFERNIPSELLKQIPEHKITPATFIQKLLPYILKSELTDSEILQNVM